MIREFQFNQIDNVALIRALAESERRKKNPTKLKKFFNWFHRGLSVFEPLGKYWS